MVPVELVEVAFVTITTGVVGAAVAVRHALRALALRRVEESATPHAEPYRSAASVTRDEAPSPKRARRAPRSVVTSDEVVRWPRGLR